jgi:cytochrome c biogenesis protein CcmG/thiol:disulfide interchange protein DsbE
MARNLLILVAILCGITLATQMLDDRDRTTSAVRPVIPDFTFMADGKETTLYAQRNDIVLIHFWATWCAPCLTEFPALIKRIVKEKNVTLIAVSVDYADDDMEAFLKKYKKTPMIAVFDKELKISRRFGVRQFPETLVLDRDFRLIHHVVGPADWKNYRFPVR